MSDCIDHGQAGRRDYGKGRGKFRNSNLHRQVFFETNGYLPQVVRHTCDNPRCINPAHLVGGTHSDNMQDRANRGRAPQALPSHRKLSMEQAREIRRRRDGRVTYLAREYGVAAWCIYNIWAGATYRE